jgi:hypothetical protein
MTRRPWGEGLDLGIGGTRDLEVVGTEPDHFERCPFCSQVFDLRDLGQVLTHYDCPLAAGAPPSKDLTRKEDRPNGPAKVLMLKRRN